MAPDPMTMLTILLMALATYATRAGGLWLTSRLKMSGRVEAWLNYVPGAILISLVAPTVLAGGIADTLAAVAVLIVALRTGSLPAAMVTGVGAVLLFRTFL
ncbi:MAG TPA: AzlD domain-containing protein [Rubrobacteraceae bacterium]|nr:AzlD domain-containing protein [Rubrobacteraceae bacterium]